MRMENIERVTMEGRLPTNDIQKERKEFSVPQIEYPQGGSSKTGSHVYFLLQVFWEILLFCQIVLLFDRNVVQYDITIVVPWQLSTGSKHDYPFC